MKKMFSILVVVICGAIENDVMSCIEPMYPSVQEIDLLHEHKVEITRKITQKFNENADKNELLQIAENEFERKPDIQHMNDKFINYEFYGYYFFRYLESIIRFLKRDDANLNNWEKIHYLSNDRLALLNKAKQAFDNRIVSDYKRNRFTNKNYKKHATKTINRGFVWYECEITSKGLSQSELGYSEEYWYYTSRLLSILTFKGYTDEQRDELFFEMYPQLKELEDTKELYKPQTCCVIM